MQKILGENQHAIGKNWTQNAPFAPIFLKISRGRPPDPHLQEGDIHSRSYTAKGKNSPASRISERSFEDKNYGKIWGGKSTCNRQKLDSECTICIHFSKKFPGEAPRTPTCGRGFPPPTPSPCGASRRFGYAPPAVDPLDPPLNPNANNLPVVQPSTNIG